MKLSPPLTFDEIDGGASKLCLKSAKTVIRRRTLRENPASLRAKSNVVAALYGAEDLEARHAIATAKRIGLARIGGPATLLPRGDRVAQNAAADHPLTPNEPTRLSRNQRDLFT